MMRCALNSSYGWWQVILNKIFGYLPGRIASFVMNLHTFPKEIYLSRCAPARESRVSDRLYSPLTDLSTHEPDPRCWGPDIKIWKVCLYI
jgi:hypothetical protein